MVADLKTKQIYTRQDCAYRQMTLWAQYTPLNFLAEGIQILHEYIIDTDAPLRSWIFKVILAFNFFLLS